MQELAKWHRGKTKGWLQTDTTWGIQQHPGLPSAVCHRYQLHSKVCTALTGNRGSQSLCTTECYQGGTFILKKKIHDWQSKYELTQRIRYFYSKNITIVPHLGSQMQLLLTSESPRQITNINYFWFYNYQGTKPLRI